MGEHLTALCCGIENMKEPGKGALQWSERQCWKGDGGKYSEGLAVNLTQAIPAGGGGALPFYTSWDSSYFSATYLKLHAGHQV